MNPPATWSLSEADLAAVAQRLGRQPEGRCRVAVRDEHARPVVIENHPAVAAADGSLQPFPTTHWLIDPGLVAAVGRLESAGAIAAINHRLANDPDLVARWAADHRRLIAYRLSLLTGPERDALAAVGRLAGLEQRGIAGVADFRRVKCLHAVLAHHLAVGNALGSLVRGHMADAGLSSSTGRW